MTHSFVPDDYVVPVTLTGPGFRLEPLGAQHNDADHSAWMSSIEHIRARLARCAASTRGHA